MRLLNFILGALLLLIAALQWNDPDAAYWIAVYAGGAAVAIGKGLGHYNHFRTTLLTGAVLAGMILTLPGTLQYLAAGDYGSIFGDMRPDNYVEPAREFFGLLLLLAILCGYLRNARHQNA